MSGPGFPAGTTLAGPPAAATAPPATTPRVKLTVTDLADSSTVLAVQLLSSVSIDRDLRDIAGSFEIELIDVAREVAAGNVWQGSPGGVMIAQGMQASIAIDNTPVLVGRVDAVKLSGDATTDKMTIRGRDRTCGLVDCAAAPNGPTEFRNLTLTQIAQRICQPFGINVTAQTDVGAPFVVAALNPHDTAHAFLEGLARQRSTLLASDGVGGLLLTVGGSSQAPASIVRGQNIWRYDCARDWSKRFSDYYVKGQTNSAGYATGAAGMTHATAPGANPVDSGYAKPTILMTGHAVDPQIQEYRPTVRMTRSQSGMASTQDQAEWALRVAQGEADQLMYSVKDWRAGPNNDLWLPNQQVLVVDPMLGINDWMLIAGVHWKYSNAEGAVTELRVVGLTAYDQTNLAARRRPRGAQNTALQSSFSSLYVP